MKQRDPLVATLLSLFIPFYAIYWFYVTAKQLQVKGIKTPSAALLFSPLLLIVLVIVLVIIGSINSSNYGDTNTTASFGLAGLMFLLFPVIWGLTLYYYYKFGEAVEIATNKELTKGLLFVLFWFVAPAGVFLTQDKLNKMGDTTPPASPVDTVPPEAPTPPLSEPPSNPVSK